MKGKGVANEAKLGAKTNPASGQATRKSEKSGAAVQSESVDLKQRYLEKLKGKRGARSGPAPNLSTQGNLTSPVAKAANENNHNTTKQSTDNKSPAQKRKREEEPVFTQTKKSGKGETVTKSVNSAKPAKSATSKAGVAEVSQKRKERDRPKGATQENVLQPSKKQKTNEPSADAAKKKIDAEKKQARPSTSHTKLNTHAGSRGLQEGNGPKSSSPAKSPARNDSSQGGTKPVKGERKAPNGAGKGSKGERGPAAATGSGNKNRGEDEEGSGKFPFEVDPADHAETPAEAYEDIAPMLTLLTEAMGKTKETLRVYDPYFCDGGVTRRLRRHGFTNVYNRREDFYKVIEEGAVPTHDVVLTNPPYSADHMDRILHFVCKSGKPWLLLVPNFVYTKDYYQQTALAAAQGGNTKPPMYLVPNKRYTYWTPPWLHQTKFGESTSPFPSFWFLQFGKYADAVAKKFLQLPQKQRASVTLARGIEELPNEVRAAFDPNKKRKSSKARKRMAKQRAEKRAQA